MSGGSAGRLVAFVVREGEHAEEVEEDAEVEEARARRTSPCTHPANHIAWSGNTNASSASRIARPSTPADDGEARVGDDEVEEDAHGEERVGAQPRIEAENRKGYGGKSTEEKKDGEREEGRWVQEEGGERGNDTGEGHRDGRMMRVHHKSEGWEERKREPDGDSVAQRPVSASAPAVVRRRRIRLARGTGAGLGTEAPTPSPSSPSAASPRSTHPQFGAKNGRKGTGRNGEKRDEGWEEGMTGGGRRKGGGRGDRRSQMGRERTWREGAREPNGDYTAQEGYVVYGARGMWQKDGGRRIQGYEGTGAWGKEGRSCMPPTLATRSEESVQRAQRGERQEEDACRTIDIAGAYDKREVATSMVGERLAWSYEYTRVGSASEFEGGDVAARVNSSIVYVI
ncbi:hypothetical protein B0H17DRAFT_1135159 [Mycena rosella]|uniref:Uncharacterized protein n=1 Tax=Mycena rosella TaxID=1033263 RepID=A0AAD7DEJ5_MYCRO|nr:hypothetical protein B0H17DRAFT_1135159 [Mycena rosella]